MKDRHRKNRSAGYIAKLLVLISYLAFLFWRMFFYAYRGFFRTQSKALEYNLVPFRTIYSLLSGYEKYGFVVWAYNLFGNIAVFIPLGFLIVSLQREKRSVKKTAVMSFFIILFAELMQLITRVGVFDIDDIILNLIGTLLGCCLYIATFGRHGTGK